ncbi:hypothetical protein ASG76_00855 [Nocardioides sp. Soil774]|uniref:acyltransferase family protein n=1 Tax=Nocardioides sp. Soil774 TaxID=1736408 RepID=UPI0006F269C0|nr:acyltransferase [Nocardioides sp. Soil774]KRE97311.1 hypothetical protein ASG76_00855 [Nocardioides sp. Soil774]
MTSSSTATSVDRRRYIELDGLRGIAVLAVVLCHYGNELDRYFPGLPPAAVSGEPVGWLLRYGYFGVQLFFLLSGFVILLTARKVATPRDFVVARVSRLYPTYWACLTVTALVGWLSAQAVLQRLPLEVALNYSMVQRLIRVEDVDAAYWSLSVELIFYGIIWSVFMARGALRDKDVERLVLVWLTVALVVASWYRVTDGSSITLVVLLLTASQYAGFFSAGMLLLLSRERGRLHPLVAVCVLAQAVVSWLVVDAVEATVVVPLMAFFAYVIMQSRVGWLRVPGLVFIGAISYPLYLLHQNLGYLLIEAAAPSLGRWPAMLLGFAALAGVAWVAHRTVEGPWSHALRKRLSRQPDVRRARP